MNIKNYKIIIVEWDGVRRTFLDLLGYDVVYTNNNNINTRNYGIKELCDVNYCIIALMNMI